MIGGLFIKRWGKKNKLVDKDNLSSYAIILMFLYFLI